MDDGSQPLRGKIRALLLCRQLVIFLALGGVALAAPATGEWPGLTQLAPYLVLIAACLANATYLVAYLRGRARMTRLAVVQVAGDVLLAAALVYLTGGANSPFTVLFFAIVFSVAILASTGWAVASACGSGAFLVAVALLYHATTTGLVVRLPLVDPGYLHGIPENLGVSISFVLQEMGAFVLVGLLAGTLSERLFGSRHLTDTILHTMSDGLLVVNQTGGIAFMNARAREMLGFLGPAPPNINARELLEQTGHEPLAKMVADGRMAQKRLVLAGPRNSDLQAFVATRPLADRKQQPKSLLVMMYDLSDRIRMEEAEKRMARLEVVSSMAASIAHEIRNPLASIRGSAQKISDLPLDDGHKNLLRLIVESSDRLNKIVSEFLQFSRHRRMKLRKTYLRRLADDVVALLRERFADCSLKFTVEAPEALALQADHDQLMQVFLNLGINACEAMGREGELTIRASSDEDDSGQHLVRVVFADTGPGVEPENAKKLFQPFFTTKSRGTGLGLAVVERIVEMHGGGIEVVSEPGQGATFVIRLLKEPSTDG